MEIYRGENEIYRFIEKVFQERIKIMTKYFKKDYVMGKKKKDILKKLRHVIYVTHCILKNIFLYYEIIVIYQMNKEGLLTKVIILISN